MSELSLSALLAKKHFPEDREASPEKLIEALQLKMLRIQEGIWHSKRRAIVLFEGFDTAGKGGAILRLTEKLDPRSIRVHSIGPPAPADQAKHYLYRFWRALPAPGTTAIFDRSWYGRLLVERVEKLTPKKRWKQAFEEINQFEKMLVHDGVDLVKIFLAIHPAEQLKRFKARISDPSKQWKLNEDDLEAHEKWKDYVKAADDIFEKTDTHAAPWSLVPADSKEFARTRVLKIVTDALSHHGRWMEKASQRKQTKELRKELKKIEKLEH